MSLQDDLANEAIRDLDEYLNTQPIGRARAYELFHNCCEATRFSRKPARTTTVPARPHQLSYSYPKALAGIRIPRTFDHGRSRRTFVYF